MFDYLKLRLKIRDFRRNDVRTLQYDSVMQTISLKSWGGRHAVLDFKLVNSNGKRRLAFFGDIIARDPEVLSRVMKLMWDRQLPVEFSEDAALRKQIFDDGVSTDTPIYFRDIAPYVIVPN